MRLIITDRTKIIYSVYRAGDVSVHQECCERATQPYSLGVGGTIYPGSRPADVSTRRPRKILKIRGYGTKISILRDICFFDF